MRNVQFVFSANRLRIVPRRYFFFVVILLLFSTSGFLFSILMQYETKANTEYVEGTITNVRLSDTFAVRGSRLLLLFEVNGEEYYIWYPNDGDQGYAQLMSFDFNVNNLSVELLVSKQFGKNRVVDFRCDDHVFFSIDAENKRIHQEKVTAFIFGICTLFLCLIIQFIILCAYNVIKIRRRK